MSPVLVALWVPVLLEFLFLRARFAAAAADDEVLPEYEEGSSSSNSCPGIHFRMAELSLANVHGLPVVLSSGVAYGISVAVHTRAMRCMMR